MESQALVAEHAQGAHLRRWSPRQLYLSTLMTSSSARHAVFIDFAHLLGLSAAAHPTACRCAGWAQASSSPRHAQHFFARQSIVREHADLDQAMFVHRIPFDGGGQSVAADHDDRVEVMGFGAVHLALRGES